MNYRRRSDNKAREIYDPADGFVSSEISHSVYREITVRFGRTMGARMDFMRVK